MAENRPIAVWIAALWTVAAPLVDIFGPLIFARPISSSALYWVQYGAMLVGVLGFWRLRWWGPFVVLALAIVSYTRLTLPFWNQPDLLTYGLVVNGVVTLVLMGPLLLVSLGYRKRFSWRW